MNNAWSAFEALTDKTNIKVAQIIQHAGTESVCQDLNMNQFRVPGTDYPIGSDVYIQNGVIVSEAVSLTPAGTHYV